MAGIQDPTVLAGVTPCVEWEGYRNSDGYGRCRYKGKVRNAHSAAYEEVNGPVPEGLELDHLCRNRGCVNPDHLEAVTHAENMKRGANTGKRVPYCKHGHEFTNENTYIYPATGKRACRECRRRTSLAAYYRGKND